MGKWNKILGFVFIFCLCCCYLNRKLWDALTGNELHTFDHKHIVKAAEFSPDEKFIVTAGNEKLIRLYDLQNYDAEPLVRKPYTPYIWKTDTVVRFTKLWCKASGTQTIHSIYMKNWYGCTIYKILMQSLWYANHTLLIYEKLIQLYNLQNYDATPLVRKPYTP